MILTVALLMCEGCTFTKIPYVDPQCNIQAHIDQRFVDYLSHRFQKGSTPRIAIIPFDVPANFSPVNNPELRFGFKLAEIFQRKILAKGEKLIVELFNRDEWPGKSLDFSTGNYTAIKQARDAGYDLVLVGKFENIVDSQVLSIQSKIIETESTNTIWFGTSQSFSKEAQTKGFLNFLSRGVYPLREDVFHISERTEALVSCTVDRVFSLQLPPES